VTADILKKIVDEKHRELKVREQLCSLSEIKQLAGLADPVRGFKASLLQRSQQQLPAVIAEIKKASPSKGVIRESFDPVQIARSYELHGASCLSILTDHSFFQGHEKYLIAARAAVKLPVLRKDFTVSPYQIYEARSINADCILLIVSILTDEELLTFHALAKSLQMDVLVEVHDEDEMDRALRINPDILGVNNRNLRTFDVSLDTTFDLMNKVADSTLLVTESGIHTQDDVTAMLGKGIYSFLVGEAFMRSKEPGLKLAELFDTDR